MYYLFVKAWYVQSFSYGFFIEYVIEKGSVTEKVLLPFDFQFSLITEDERLTVALEKVDCVLTGGESQKNRSQELALDFLQKNEEEDDDNVDDELKAEKFLFVIHACFFFFVSDSTSSIIMPSSSSSSTSSSSLTGAVRCRMLTTFWKLPSKYSMRSSRLVLALSKPHTNRVRSYTKSRTSFDYYEKSQVG